MITSVEAVATLQLLAQRHNLTIDQVAGMLGISYATARKWVQGDGTIESPGRRLIELVAMLDAFYADFFATLVPAAGIPTGRTAKPGAGGSP